MVPWKAPPVKLSSKNIIDISSNLINQAKNIPVEFNRKPRSLLEAKRWKAIKNLDNFCFTLGLWFLKEY